MLAKQAGLVRKPLMRLLQDRLGFGKAKLVAQDPRAPEITGEEGGETATQFGKPLAGLFRQVTMIGQPGVFGGDAAVLRKTPYRVRQQRFGFVMPPHRGQRMGAAQIGFRVVGKALAHQRPATGRLRPVAPGNGQPGMLV